MLRRKERHDCRDGRNGKCLAGRDERPSARRLAMSTQPPLIRVTISSVGPATKNGGCWMAECGGECPFSAGNSVASPYAELPLMAHPFRSAFDCFTAEISPSATDRIQSNTVQAEQLVDPTSALRRWISLHCAPSDFGRWNEPMRFRSKAPVPEAEAWS